MTTRLPFQNAPFDALDLRVVIYLTFPMTFSRSIWNLARVWESLLKYPSPPCQPECVSPPRAEPTLPAPLCFKMLPLKLLAVHSFSSWPMAVAPEFRHACTGSAHFIYYVDCFLYLFLFCIPHPLEIVSCYKISLTVLELTM